MGLTSDHLADDVLAAAIAGCEREPIHLPGSIQPHGVLFVLSIDDAARVVASSDNAPVDRLDDWLDPSEVARVVEAASRLEEAGRAHLPDLRDRRARCWTATLSRRDAASAFVLALEPTGEVEPSGSDARDNLFETVNDTAERLARATTVEVAARIAAEAVRTITGFDRVMAYRFENDWSGVVIAESLGPADAIGSFVGLRFPASDIPAQARALYETDRVRIIPDAEAAPVAIGLRARPPADPSPAPVDLTGVAIRGVSPIHVVYLANMGVRASMSVAVRDERGRLWGLLACHHEAGPLRPSPRVRIAAELIARTLANRVASLLTDSEVLGRARVAGLRERILTGLVDTDAEFGAVLAPLGPDLATSLAADLVLIADGPETMFASRPSARAPADLADALGRLAPDGECMIDHLAASGLGGAGDALVAAGHAGLVARRLVGGTHEAAIWLLWLRGERRRDVTWAGNPDKSAVRTADGLPILSPRRSFASWNEEVRDHCEPFTPADRAAADAIADAVARAMARRSAAVARAVRELRGRNEQIRFFADAAVHDLREPLWQIQVFAGMLREELAQTTDAQKTDAQKTDAQKTDAQKTDAQKTGAQRTGAQNTGAPPDERAPDRIASEQRAMAEMIESSALRMRDLVDDLSRFAMAGADPDRLRPRPILDLVREAQADLRERLGSADAVVTVTEDMAIVSCDGTQIRRVFQNLLSNSIKYRNHERRLAVRVGLARLDRGLVAIHYADNGIGFDPAERERIFEPFRRLGREREADVAEGLGLGLAICRRIVEGHGGSIVAEGSPGEGARFTVVLPEDGPPT